MSVCRKAFTQGNTRLPYLDPHQTVSALVSTRFWTGKIRVQARHGASSRAGTRSFQLKKNYLAEMSSDSEEGSYLRRCITQL